MSDKENSSENEKADLNAPLNAPSRRYAGTRGRVYADLHFSGEDVGDEEWLIEAINSGALLICPRCEFLHLPTFPLPLGIHRGPAPVDACDICAHAFFATDLPWQIDAEMMLEAREELDGARAERARLLYDLWMGASLAAETWLMARLGDVLEEVKAETRPAHAATKS